MNGKSDDFMIYNDYTRDRTVNIPLRSLPDVDTQRISNANLLRLRGFVFRGITQYQGAAAEVRSGDCATAKLLFMNQELKSVDIDSTQEFMQVLPDFLPLKTRAAAVAIPPAISPQGGGELMALLKLIWEMLQKIDKKIKD